MDIEENSENNENIQTPAQITNTEDEDFVVASIGAFGVWQLEACIVPFLIRSITMWNMLTYIFLTHTSIFKCVKFEANVSLDVKNSTCYENCIEYEFGSKIFADTLVSEFGLICENKWMANIIQTTLMFGMLVGVSLFGWISDRYGRRIAIIMSSLINLSFMIIAPLSPNYWVFNCMRFLMGVSSGGTLTTTIVFMLEIVGPRYREAIGTAIILPDGLGEASLALFAYYSPNWRIYMFEYTAISTVIVVFVFLLPETPRWLISKGNGEKAAEIMTRAALRNKLDTTQIQNNITKELEENKRLENVNNKLNYLDLFGTYQLAYKTLATTIMWISAGVCYFGINQYLTFFGSDIYTSVILSGAVQVLTFPPALIVIKTFKRRSSTISSFIIVGVTMIALTFVSIENWASIVLGLVGLAATSIIFCVMYIYMTELFPTPLRNMAYGMGTSGTKVGAMIAPFIATVSPRWIASLIFAVISFGAAACCWFLSETKGAKLQDTLN